MDEDFLALSGYSVYLGRFGKAAAPLDVRLQDVYGPVLHKLPEDMSFAEGAALPIIHAPSTSAPV